MSAALPAGLVLPLAAASAVSTEQASHSVGYPSLFGLVLLGSILPVVPTGALVAAAAVVAWHLTSPMNLLAVFATGSVAAYTGDMALYWAAGRGGRQLARLTSRVETRRLEWAKRKLIEHRWSTLILSRLTPAGRIPVMVACVAAQMPLRRFATADAVAALVWTFAYAAVGIAGASVFPEPWQGIVAVVAVVLLFTVLGPKLTGRRRNGDGSADGSGGGESPDGGATGGAAEEEGGPARAAGSA